MPLHAIGLRKLLANLLSALAPTKALRHRLRYALHPLNDQRCRRYFAQDYVVQGFPSPLRLQPIAALNPEKEYIWQCWLQGREAAPPLIDYCLRSVEQHKRPEQELILLTEANYSQYVHFPEHILERRRQGLIADAQFSDLLRIYLLAQYGGCWIDATCLLTAPIPDWILAEDFFVYQSHGEFAYTGIQSCFIRARSRSPLIQQWRYLMAELWAHERQLLHYFQLHLMLRALIDTNEEASQRYAEMPKVSEEATHRLQQRVKETQRLTQDMVRAASAESYLHKLSYKLVISETDLFV